MAIFAGCAATTTRMAAVETQQPEASKRVVKIQASDEMTTATVSIEGSSPLTYTSVKQPFPLGVVLYFPKTAIDTVAANAVTENGVVSAIETHSSGADGSAARINILLKQDIPYHVTQNGSRINVVFEKTTGNDDKGTAARVDSEPAGAEAGHLLAANDVQLMQVDAATTPASDTDASPKASAVMPAKPAWVNRIDFSSEDAGKSTIIIGTSRSIEYDIQKVTDTHLKLRLHQTNIPDFRQRQLITTRFESAVDRIIPVQTKAMKDNSMVSIELREAVPYFIESSDNLIMVHFEASSIPPRPFETAQLPPWKQIISGALIEPEIEVAEMAPEEDAGATVSATDQYFEKKVYTGEKIALDFYETDIKNVFRILREISGKNFIIDDDVQGKVTMTLEKPVPWDQILDLVLKMNQLGLVYEGDIIRIATLKTIKAESEALMESITAEREAKETIKDLAPLITEYISISYSNAKEEVLPHLESIITKDRGSISVDERNNQVIITDTAEKIAMAREIVKNIDKVTPQVIIEAKIVEMSSELSKEIGIEWGMTGGITPTDARAGVGPQRGYDVLGGTYAWTTAMNFPSASNSGIGFNFTRIAGTPFVLDATLTALASDGEVKIVSAPKVVTLDNKKATIKQGVEVGYYDQPSDTNNTNQVADVEWKDVDLSLEVTPHVTPDSRISMSIMITKNDIIDYFDGIPAIATNEAETELLVNDGDTIVIGGIMKTTKSSDETGFPVLSKIPGMGWLFRHQLENNSNNEMLIFITPRIVQLEQRAM